MNPRITIALALLVLGIGAAVWWLGHEEAQAQGKQRSVLLPPEAIGADLVAIHFRDAEGGSPEEPVRLAVRSDGTLVLRFEPAELGPLAPPGESKPARVSALQDLVFAGERLIPLRVLDPEPDPAAIRGAGLEQQEGLRIRFEQRDGSVHTLHFGAGIGAGGRVVRVNDAGPLLVVDSRAAEALAPPIGEMLEPRLLSVGIGDVDAIRVLQGEQLRLELGRTFDEWFLRHPFDAAAESSASDRLRNTLVFLEAERRLKAEPTGLFEAAASAGRHYRVELTLDRQTEPLILEFARADDAGPVCARVLPEGPVAWVRGDPFEQLSLPASSYRAHRVTQVASERIRGIRLLDREGHADIAYAREGDDALFFRPPLARGEGLGKRLLACDPIEAQTLLEAVAELRFEPSAFDHEARLPADEVAARVVLRVLAEDAPDELELSELLIGAEERGVRTRRVAVVGQPGVGRIPRDELRFLDREWWRMLDRRLVVTDAYFRFHRMSLRSEGGPIRTIAGGLDEDAGALAGALEPQGGGEERSVPPALMASLVTGLLGGIPVDAWVAPAAEGESRGFEEPWLEFRWYESFDAKASGMPSGDEGAMPRGEWRRLAIGDSVEGDARWFRLETDFHAEGRIATANLGPLLRLLEWAES